MIERITSRNNQRLVYARKVRDGKVREHIFIEGRRLAAEAVRSGLEIVECYISDEFRDGRLLSSIADDVPIAEAPRPVFNSIADTKQPQGIILLAKRPDSGQKRLADALSSASMPIVLALTETNNSSNLGAILRTADAAGVAGVIVSEGSAGIFSPKALRAAMGSAFRLPVWTDADWPEILGWTRSHNLVTTATSASASIRYTEIDWNVPRLLVFGSEARGLDPAIIPDVGQMIKIPMENGVESLNLAVSAGIICFEAKRQVESVND